MAQSYPADLKGAAPYPEQNILVEKQERALDRQMVTQNDRRILFAIICGCAVALAYLSPSVPMIGWFTFKVMFAVMLVSYALLSINIVYEWNRRPRFLFGKVQNPSGPNLCFIDFIFTVVLPDIPLQNQVMVIEVKETRTKDNIPVFTRWALTWRAEEATLKNLFTEVQDPEFALEQRAKASVVDGVRKNDLDHAHDDATHFTQSIKDDLGTRISGWGISIVAFELIDFQITDEDTREALSRLARTSIMLKSETAIAASIDTLCVQFGMKKDEFRRFLGLLQGFESGKSIVLESPTAAGALARSMQLPQEVPAGAIPKAIP